MLGWEVRIAKTLDISHKVPNQATTTAMLSFFLALLDSMWLQQSLKHFSQVTFPHHRQIFFRLNIRPNLFRHVGQMIILAERPLVVSSWYAIEEFGLLPC